jgi:hypothetical protein
MERTWLVQRLEKPWPKESKLGFKTNPFSFGGALHKLWELAQQKRLIAGDCLDGKVFFIAAKDEAVEVKSRIASFAKSEDSSLKEPVELKEALAGKGRVCGWLELDNGFFFFTDAEMFKKTKQLFGLER